jgi:hypothetical protein
MRIAGSSDLKRHPGITFHKMPVAGVGGFFLVVGVILIAVIGLPIGKWFLLGAVILGVCVVGLLRLGRKLKPRTEVEEVQLNIERPPTPER